MLPFYDSHAFDEPTRTRMPFCCCEPNTRHCASKGLAFREGQHLAGALHPVEWTGTRVGPASACGLRNQ